MRRVVRPVLDVLADEGVYSVDFIAAITEIEAHIVRVTLSRALARGLVKAIPAKNGTRGYLYELTPAGARHLSKITEQQRAQDAALETTRLSAAIAPGANLEAERTEALPSSARTFEGVDIDSVHRQQYTSSVVPAQRQFACEVRGCGELRITAHSGELTLDRGEARALLSYLTPFLCAPSLGLRSRRSRVRVRAALECLAEGPQG